MRKITSRKGAIELSIGTIVIIVIALTMLILGIVLVRSIMCGAISLTSDTTNAARKEVSKLFEATGGEVQCVGNSGEAVVMTPGKVNIVWCGIRAGAASDYKIEIIDIQSTDKDILSASALNQWKSGPDYWTGKVSPADELPKKVLRLDIPNDAPETGIIVKIRAAKPGTDFVSTQDLDFRISRQGLIKAAMC